VLAALVFALAVFALAHGHGSPDGLREKKKELTLSSSTIQHPQSSSQPSCNPSSLTISPTFKWTNGLDAGADAASNEACVDLPVPGVPVRRIMGCWRGKWVVMVIK
jgi:hypothetical protein